MTTPFPRALVKKVFLSLTLGAAFAAYGAVFLDFQKLYRSTGFYVFQARDLLRTLDLLHGHWVFFGPEMTGGGNLPGPLYYWILALGQMIQPTPDAAWWEMLCLAGIAAVIAAAYLRSVNLSLAALLWIPLFVINIQTLHYLTIFLNPSFLFIFVVTALVFICRSVSPGLTRERDFLLASLTVGLGLQLHYSIIVLFAALLFLHLFANRLELPRVSGRTMVLGCLVFLSPSLPFLVWRTLSGAGAPYSGESSSSLPTLYYLLTGLVNISWDSLFPGVFVQLQRVVPMALPLILMAIWICRRKEPLARHPLLKPLTVCALFGFIPFSYVFFVPIGNRYTMPLYLALLFVCVTALALSQRAPKTLRLYNILAGAALVIAWLFILTNRPEIVGSFAWQSMIAAAITLGAMAIVLRRNLHWRWAVAATLTVALACAQYGLSRTNILNVNPHLVMTRQNWLALWQDISGQTGWSLTEMKERIFFVNMRIDSDPELAYTTVRKYLAPGRHLVPEPDGYFVVTRFDDQEPVLESILNSPMSHDIHDALLRGEMQLGAYLPGSVVAVPYYVKSTLHLPRHFQNWPLYYNKSSDEILLSAGHELEGSAKVADHRYFFHWNECPDHHAYCETGALVTLRENVPGAFAMTVRIVGESLSQISPWIHPTWTEGWDLPFVEAHCGKRIQKFPLANSIGYKREFLIYDSVNHYMLNNNSLLAPFERTFQFACAGKITQLSVGRAGTSVEKLRSSEILPAKKITLAL